MAVTNITYRRGKPADASAISELGTRVFSNSFGYSVSPQDLELYNSTSYSPAQIGIELEDPARTFVVGTTANGAIVAFMELTMGTSEPCIDHLEKKIEVQRLYVSEECQGMGVGSKLLKKADEMAKEMGFEKIWLGVWGDNLKAQKTYERAGYVKVGDHDFVLGKHVFTDWVMAKEL